jgi:hypothetical protein
MKTKTWSLSVLIFGMTSLVTTAADFKIIVNNDDPAEFSAPLKVEAGLIRAAAVQHSLHVLAAKPEMVEVASLCSSASPNVVASRLNAMNGLVGLPVTMDPADPAAWYVVAPNAWEWHHIVSLASVSPNVMWRGKTSLLTPAQSAEKGNRVVVHAMGQYPVSAYECEVMTSLTNIATARFFVGKDGAGNELPFSANFVGLKFGANGILESTRNPISGLWTQVGDDTVYSNGELPSAVQYDAWVRFGATAVITAGNLSVMDGVKAQFTNGVPTFTARLIKNGTEVHSKMVTAMQLHLSIARGPVDPNPYDVVTINGGTEGVTYHIEYAYDPSGPWIDFGDNLFNSQTVYIGRIPEVNQFYRAKAMPAVAGVLPQ